MITEEMVRKKAYELWQFRGESEGNAQEDWLKAEALLKEQQLKLELQKSTAKDPKDYQGRYGLRQVS